MNLASIACRLGPLLALPFLAVAGGTAAAPPSAAATPGANGDVVFTRDLGGGNTEIYVVAPGGFETRLTNVTSEDTSPAFSPDGGSIVFLSDRAGGETEVYRMNADGTGVTRLTTSSAAESSPSYSPDGRFIIFSSNRRGSFDIYRMPADGGTATRVTSANGYEGNPSYSPDGRRIAFMATSDFGGLAIPHLSVMDADGTGAGQLSTTWDNSPSWSPDGSSIIFTVQADGSQTVYRIGADGLGRTQLTSGGGLFSADFDPAYSPDGTSIVYASTDDGDGVDLYTAGSDGRSPIALTDSEHDDSEPNWGPAYVECQGRAATITGTASNDVLTGTPGPDVIAGLGGDDVLQGYDGADTFCGGAGADTVTYADHEAAVVANLTGGSGDDGSPEDGPAGSRDSIGKDVERVVGGFGDDVLAGSSADNTLTGGPGDDTLTGGYGADTLLGSSGDDVVSGGEGDDTLDGGADADVFNGGPGIDLASYATRTASVIASIGTGTGDDGGASDGRVGERDTIRSNVENLTGGLSADTLTGDAGDNVIKGGLGADTLLGLAGIDKLLAADLIKDVKIDCGDGDDLPPQRDATDPKAVSCGTVAP
ncbi:hypothetical protein F0U44_02135 [Nocardioides humilatus]|uniref:DUF5050 domain-containing protein n=1 Tax=Nocardioides humilatus TaxID=2607660 RepID=A0A5B1LMW4_9ACTN|nr:PD40 domain-containing protein [Nocardioides humilatus]KAA1421140.1 hypothetical protein F0U44_02135 [Nocardioides humilatus]